MISSNASTATQSLLNIKKDTEQRLREKELDKYSRDPYTDTSTGVTLTGEEIMGEICAAHCALVPITITEFGQFGSLFKRFMHGSDALPIPPITDKPNAHRLAELARSKKVPRGIWTTDHPNDFYGFSYKAMTP